MIAPFRLAVPQAGLDHLAERLQRTRWPDELPGAGRDYGIPLERVRRLAEYWRTGFDWRAQEAVLNSHPQFTTEIDGQRVHFVHVRCPDPQAPALVLTHGWPGSPADFRHVIGPLAQDFHLVVPTIPGFGLSGPTGERGWDVRRIARAWAELMRRLGYERYGAQGGDWGAGISQALAAAAPESVTGVHLNYLPTPPPPGGVGDLELSADDRERLAVIEGLMARRPGYMVLHSTRPQTLAYALTDSPVGQLAWIAEKFDEWADPRCALSDDHVLATATLLWLTATAGSSARIAKESTAGAPPCPAPVGIAVLPRDIVRSVRPLAERTHRIVHWSEFERGGHFPALEVPEAFAADVRAFFAGLR